MLGQERRRTERDKECTVRRRVHTCWRGEGQGEKGNVKRRGQA